MTDLRHRLSDADWDALLNRIARRTRFLWWLVAFQLLLLAAVVYLAVSR